MTILRLRLEYASMAQLDHFRNMLEIGEDTESGKKMAPSVRDLNYEELSQDFSSSSIYVYCTVCKDVLKMVVREESITLIVS